MEEFFTCFGRKSRRCEQEDSIGDIDDTCLHLKILVPNKICEEWFGAELWHTIGSSHVGWGMGEFCMGRHAFEVLAVRAKGRIHRARPTFDFFVPSQVGLLVKDVGQDTSRGLASQAPLLKLL